MENTVENIRAQMRKGLLDYCILSILGKHEAYASSLIEELKAAGMIVVEGTLYPLLIRQKNQGLLDYRWEESTQPRARPASITSSPTKAASSSPRWTLPGRKSLIPSTPSNAYERSRKSQPRRIRLHPGRRCRTHGRGIPRRAGKIL